MARLPWSRRATVAADDEIEEEPIEAEAPSSKRLSFLLPVGLGGLAAAVAGIGLWFLLRPAAPPAVEIQLPPEPAGVAGAPPTATEAQPMATAEAPATPSPGEPPAGLVPDAVPAPAGTPGTLPTPSFNAGKALLPAPAPDLYEKGGTGFLPIIARDGRQPWQVYARPFPLDDPHPRVAIVLGGLGANSHDTDKAINGLPGPVTLAFAPYARRLGEWITLARTAGHEVLLELPMEPADYPRQDPGPNPLLTALDKAQNLERLDLILSQVTGYVGLVGRMGTRFSTSRDDLNPVLDELHRRGLLYVDNHATPESVAPLLAADLGLAFGSVVSVIDADQSRAGVDTKLSDLEDAARSTGRAIGLGSDSYPVTLERLAVWAEGLESRGVILAPVSAVVAVPSRAAVEAAAKADAAKTEAAKPEGQKAEAAKPSPTKPDAPKPDAAKPDAAKPDAAKPEAPAAPAPAAPPAAAPPAAKESNHP